ncbi:MAG: TlpA family protein disulfide reductase [Planctomycetota bacterium]|nr:TlpA family protein disulfide reductase [Planctomycetota bacterium]
MEFTIPKRTLLAGVTALAFACGGTPTPERAETSGATAAIGAAVDDERAPAFELASLDGNTVRLADYDGQVRLVDFWAIWCKPCIQELPMLQGLQDRYAGDGFQMIGVYHSDEQPAEVLAFLQERGIDYPQAIGDDDIADGFGGVLGLPAAFLIDREGRIVQRYGGEKSPATLERNIRETLGLPAEG